MRTTRRRISGINSIPSLGNLWEFPSPGFVPSKFYRVSPNPRSKLSIAARTSWPSRPEAKVGADPMSRPWLPGPPSSQQIGPAPPHFSHPITDTPSASGASSPSTKAPSTTTSGPTPILITSSSSFEVRGMIPSNDSQKVGRPGLIWSQNSLPTSSPSRSGTASRHSSVNEVMTTILDNNGETIIIEVVPNSSDPIFDSCPRAVPVWFLCISQIIPSRPAVQPRLAPNFVMMTPTGARIIIRCSHRYITSCQAIIYNEGNSSVEVSIVR